MTTILGENINLIRPEKIIMPRKEKEPWNPQRDKVAKTRRIGVAEFFRLCLLYNYKEIEKRRSYADSF